MIEALPHPSAAEYEALTRLWEASVRTTHGFLAPGELDFYRPLVRSQALPSAELYVCRKPDGAFAAFMGIENGKIEMLFVAPDMQGKKFGKSLVTYALARGCRQVDVNEQNTAALRFYTGMGFRIESRDATDPSGKAYPILHLRFSEGAHRHDELIFRLAIPADNGRILEIIRQAQAQMCALGSAQWQDGYPAPANIAADIARGDGYVLCRSEAVIAYGAVVFDGEEAYNALDGEWLTTGDYVVVHRLAVADDEKGRGVATEFMRRTASLASARGIGAFRIDTNFDNRYMLRMLDRLGFKYCGKIVYQSGERLAFEKRL